MAGFSEINKRGGSNKACSWGNFLKKNKKNSMFIRDTSNDKNSPAESNFNPMFEAVEAAAASKE